MKPNEIWDKGVAYNAHKDRSSFPQINWTPLHFLTDVSILNFHNVVKLLVEKLKLVVIACNFVPLDYVDVLSAENIVSLYYDMKKCLRETKSTCIFCHQTLKF